MHVNPPGAWRKLARYLGLSDPLLWRCWQAISASECPTVVAVRSALLLYKSGEYDPNGLTRSSADPRHLLEVIEDLWAEAHLTNAERVQIEETLLKATNAAGQWKTKAEKGITR
jgi:hypothetical protein